MQHTFIRLMFGASRYIHYTSRLVLEETKTCSVILYLAAYYYLAGIRDLLRLGTHRRITQQSPLRLQTTLKRLTNTSPSTQTPTSLLLVKLVSTLLVVVANA